MRILVTGASGFAGKYLLRLLSRHNHEIYGTYLSKGEVRDASGSGLIQCDIRDASAVRTLTADIQPERVYHLAAQSSVTGSYQVARLVYDTNFWGAYNLFEAARQLAPHARILVVGSGHCYGFVRPRDLPVRETHLLGSHSPYATSKAAADLLAYQFFAGFGLHTVRARPFNHTGPGQSAEFVCSDFARQMAAIDLGRQAPEVSVGSLSVQRDFSDVRDVTRAYELMLENGRAGEAYNVASGRSTSIKQILKILSSFCTRPVMTTTKSERLRQVDERKLYGSTAKLRRDTAWVPEYRLRQTLRDLFEYWKVSLEDGAPNSPGKA